MRAGLRLTDVLARLRIFTGAPPSTWSPLLQPVGTVPRPRDRVPEGPASGRLGAGPAVEAALAGLSEAARASILDPVGLARPPARVGRPAAVSLPFLSAGDGGPGPLDPARQVDETTCGAAVLTMLALAGDPSLALDVARDPGRRFAELQHRVHRACARTGAVPWPMRLGTAPWAAAAVARFGDVRYAHRVVGGPGAAATLRAAVGAASSGVPVPLFTGGDLAGGWQAAVPRHVVLLVDAPRARTSGTPGDGLVRIYEPSSATLHSVPTRTLLDPGAAPPRDRAVLTAALGHWPHVVWAVLPR